MNIVTKSALAFAGGLATLVGVGWLGLQVRPAPSPLFPAKASNWKQSRYQRIFLQSNLPSSTDERVCAWHYHLLSALSLHP